MTTIGFVGGLRYFEINKAIIRSFANSQTHQLLFAGKKHPGCDLERFCHEHGIKNVVFLPAYSNEEKPRIYEQITVINSVYGSGSLEVITALPNKLYDAVLYKKPIIVSSSTYLEKVVMKYNLGFSVDIGKDNIKLLLDNYLEDFDNEIFLDGCKRYLSIVRAEKQMALERMNAFIVSMKC